MKPNQDLKEISAYIVRSFSVPQDKTTLWEKFERIALREIKAKVVRSKSELILKIIEEYVRHHEEGNPQLRLDKMLQLKITKECHCGEVASHEVWAKNGWHGFLCQHDFTRDRDAGLLKRWRKL